MSSPVQEQLRRRKLVYVALVLALMAVNTFVVRGVASTSGDRPPFPWTVAAKADELQLTELSVGEADLTGSAVRFLLTGSKGLALTVLWYESEEKKKRHEWNKLELLVRTIAKLQPHSPAPWLYQSWNIAYNVSVESDRVKDKYFYIAKGIELLSDGIRKNKDQPDMRYMIGFYFQNKFGIADEAMTLRSLFQMSCIDPQERDPNKLRPESSIDPVAFRAFVVKHPQLVRRLRDRLRCESADEIVDFLRDNDDIPCRYIDRDDGSMERRKSPLASQFPVLPMTKPITEADVLIQSDVPDDTFDNYAAARSWFTFAQDPLPPPEPQWRYVDRLQMMRETKKRIPKAPALVIFRHLPARAQSFIGERLEKEGWFDRTGWTVDQYRSISQRWFPDETIVVGQDRDWSFDAWKRASELWERHGRANGLYLTPPEENSLAERAKAYQERYNVAPIEYGNDLPADADPAMRDSLRAHRELHFYGSNRSMSNFDHHYYRAEAEKAPYTIEARKLLFQGERLRKKQPLAAIASYEKGFELWHEALRKHPKFRDDTTIQEDVYEIQIHMSDEIEGYGKERIRDASVATGLLTQGLLASTTTPWSIGAARAYSSLPLPSVDNLIGPLDQNDGGLSGVPWVSVDVGEQTRSRLNRDKPARPTTPAPAPSGGQPPPPSRPQ